jgi:hypothetical protein
MPGVRALDVVGPRVARAASGGALDRPELRIGARDGGAGAQRPIICSSRSSSSRSPGVERTPGVRLDRIAASGGMMPITVYCAPSIVTARPTTPRSPANPRCHRSWARTTDGARAVQFLWTERAPGVWMGPERREEIAGHPSNRDVDGIATRSRHDPRGGRECRRCCASTSRCGSVRTRRR